MLVKIGEVAKHFGVTTQAIRDWTAKGKLTCVTTPSGTRLYDLDDISGRETRQHVFYCRVSSRKQERDLERQVAKAKAMYPNIEIITDVGSGLNWKRKGLRSIIDRVLQRSVQEVKVFHRDRLCRFGFEILEYIFGACGARIMVCEQDPTRSAEQEFAEDLIEITHYFSCSFYGRRKYTLDETESSQTRQNSDEGVVEDDGIVQEDVQQSPR